MTLTVTYDDGPLGRQFIKTMSLIYGQPTLIEDVATWNDPHPELVAEMIRQIFNDDLIMSIHIDKLAGVTAGVL